MLRDRDECLCYLPVLSLRTLSGGGSRPLFAPESRRYSFQHCGSDEVNLELLFADDAVFVQRFDEATVRSLTTSCVCRNSGRLLVRSVGIAQCRQIRGDFIEDHGIVDGRRNSVFDSVGNLLDGTAQNLTRARLG